VKPFLHHYFRLDARSLGLFRFFFGVGLLLDLRERWRYLGDFYSNDGVLPNHNHIFNLKNEGRLVWSALHAFSTPGEAFVAFCAIAFFYVMFMVGWKTRAFQVLSLVSLVSLSARNILAAGPGDALAISMLALTMLLPLGSRFSIDAFARTWAAARDAGHEDLNRRDDLPSADDTDARRLPGWSPRSLAALGVLLQIALLMLAMAMAQRGVWRDGSGLGRALGVHLFASPTGFAVRDAGWIGALGRVVYWSQWAVPALLVIPVARGPVRMAAAALLVVHGMTYDLFTNLGLFGCTIAASGLLVVSSESWERFAKKHVAGRVRTVIYDVDCGVCYQLCKILRRYDTARHLVFQGNDLLASPEDADKPMLAWDEKSSKTVFAKLPDLDQDGKKVPIDAKLLESTVLAISPDGAVATRGGAVRDVLRAIPGLGWLGVIVGLPVVSTIMNVAYDAFARRRTGASGELGLAACGAPQAADVAHAAAPLAPSTARRFQVTALVREVLAAVLVLGVLHATTHDNDLGWKSPDSAALTKLSWWLRTPARWDIMAPEPPTVNEKLVLDALTRDERSLDLLTGAPPTLGFDQPFQDGPMWARYADNIRKEEFRSYQAAFKTYTSRRGPKWDFEAPESRITGVDALWVKQDVPSGQSHEPERLFRHGRGGKLTGASPATPVPRRELPAVPRDTEPVDPTSPEAPKELQKPPPVSPGQDLE
jgi:predicted DCC family thiol-disulfide oxidoreductase YuxK